MPNGYSLFEMDQFPSMAVDEALTAPYQLEMPFADYPQGQPPTTRIKKQRVIDLLDIDVYRVEHEFIVAKPGRAYNVTFTQFISLERFPAYYHRDQKVLLLRTRKEVASSAMHELIRDDRIAGRRRYISLDSIRTRIETLKGAWFKVANSANISSQALFGPNIHLDDRFEQASDEGPIFNMRLDWPYRNDLLAIDEQIHIGLSEDSSVVIYNSNLDEQLELAILLEVKKELLDVAQDKV